MLSLILFLQEGDTIKGKGEVYEVREDTSLQEVDTVKETSLQESDTIKKKMDEPETAIEALIRHPACVPLAILGFAGCAAYILLSQSNPDCAPIIDLSGIGCGSSGDCSSGSSGGGDCSSGSSGGCSSGSSGGDCSSGSSGGDCSSGSSGGDCSSGSSGGGDCSSGSSGGGDCSSGSNASFISGSARMLPPRKPVAVSSFTGALDGILWSSLIVSNIYANFPGTDPRIASTLFLFGFMSGNISGHSAGYRGGSEGAYVLKTISAVQLLWAYFQTLRIIYGDELTQLSESYKLHLLMATTLSIGGGLGTFALNVNDYDITAGDALFIGSNTLKGALILSAPITTAYLLSQPESIPFSGFYFDPVFGRLDGVANLAGAFLGAYISYRIAKKEDLSLLEGIVYSVVPAFAYWAALAPTSVVPEYYKIAPIFQVAFDLGTSMLVYRFIKDF